MNVTGQVAKRPFEGKPEPAELNGGKARCVKVDAAPCVMRTIAFQERRRIAIGAPATLYARCLSGATRQRAWCIGCTFSANAGTLRNGSRRKTPGAAIPGCVKRPKSFASRLYRYLTLSDSSMSDETTLWAVAYWWMFATVTLHVLLQSPLTIVGGDKSRRDPTRNILVYIL